jgi:hypothetical protein
VARLCERPGCSAPASVAYGFEADRYLVFLQPFEPELADGIRSGVLCRRHADALTPPRGWWLDDRRDERPRLFVPRTPAPDPSHASQRTRTARTRRPKPDVAAEPAPSLFDDPAPEGDAETEAPPAVGGPPATNSDPPIADEASPSGDASTSDEPSTSDELSTADDGSTSDDPAATPHTGGDDDPDETRAMPWVPSFDRGDDLGGVLRARSPLLSRAFGARPDKPL